MFSFRLKQVPIVRGRSPLSAVRKEQGIQAEAQELVWNFLLKNQDRFAGDSSGDSSLTVVSNLRQEEIAVKIGVPLHRVIEAIQELSTEHRLSVFAQGPGNPNQYILRRSEAKSPERIAL